MFPSLAVGVGLILAALEWRRENERHRFGRVAATLLAAGVLGLLAQPAPPPGESPVTEATLWTAGAKGAIPAPIGLVGFALADADIHPPEALVIPDVGTMRRRHPHLRTLHVMGDGVDAAEAVRLGGLHVIPHPGATPTTPGITSANFTGELVVGSELTVQGRVTSQMNPAATVSLEGPDGSITTAPLSDGRFSLRTAPLAAAGRFVWRLNAEEGGKILTREQIGVAVTAPELPRLLVLESSPRVDTARLKRWYAPLGGSLTVRTQISRQRTRDAVLAEARADFAEVNAGVLAGFDLVLTDARALAALTVAERGALQAAVHDTGLGLLLLGDAPEAGPLAPWRLEPVAGLETGATERLVRPRGIDRPFEVKETVPALPAGIGLAPGQRALLRDGQDRVLAASVADGRGLLAITLVRDTWRWTQSSEPGAFAAYWSGLFSSLSRRVDGATGRWTIDAADQLHPLVNHPVVLHWRGAEESRPGDAHVTSDANRESVTLAMAQSSREPAEWSGVFWPAAAGWHRVVAEGAAVPLDFFVDAPGAWAHARAVAKRNVTQRIASESMEAPASALAMPASSSRGWFLAILISCLSYLWLESRFAPQGR